jgi:hypothetical protein
MEKSIENRGDYEKWRNVWRIEKSMENGEEYEV